jgi:hypothetical protein
MIHMHSMLSSETNTSSAAKSSGALLGHAALDKATLDSFHGALSDAVSSTLEKFGIHPRDVNISITPANADPTGPTRTAPPTPGTTPSTSESGSSGSSSTTSGAPNASGAPNGGYDPFLQAAYNNPYQNAPAQTSTKSSAETTPAPLDAQQIFDNNDWAQQPPAVQP